MVVRIWDLTRQILTFEGPPKRACHHALDGFEIQIQFLIVMLSTLTTTSIEQVYLKIQCPLNSLTFITPPLDHA
jgi:hypothetical protein